MREMKEKKKKYLEALIVLRLKWTGRVKIKHKDFIDAVSIIPCQNSLWIMGLSIYGEWRTQILLNSPTTIGLLARQGLY